MAQTLATGESISLSKRSTALQYGILEKELAEGNKCVSFHNIRYEVSRQFCWKKQPKTILDNVRCQSFVLQHSTVKLHFNSGIMKTGVNAILGPTGSGKTT